MKSAARAPNEPARLKRFSIAPLLLIGSGTLRTEAHRADFGLPSIAIPGAPLKVRKGPYVARIVSQEIITPHGGRSIWCGRARHMLAAGLQAFDSSSGS